MNRKEDSKRVLIGVLIMMWVMCLPLSAQSAKDGKADIPKAAPEVEKFETAINVAITKSFSGPFGLVDPPKGGFLPAYGYVFFFRVNINKGMLNTPFGIMRTGPEITPEEKKRRIEELKDGLVRVFFDTGNDLAHLQKNESIAIFAFLEEMNVQSGAGKENHTLVLSVSKGDLTELANKPDRYNQFKQRVKVIEY